MGREICKFKTGSLWGKQADSARADCFTPDKDALWTLAGHYAIKVCMGHSNWTIRDLLNQFLEINFSSFKPFMLGREEGRKGSGSPYVQIDLRSDTVSTIQDTSTSFSVRLKERARSSWRMKRTDFTRFSKPWFRHAAHRIFISHWVTFIHLRGPNPTQEDKNVEHSYEYMYRFTWSFLENFFEMQFSLKCQ